MSPECLLTRNGEIPITSGRISGWQVEIEVEKLFCICERKLVLVAHDESTCQANDGPKAGWVMEGEQPLKKKGVGRVFTRVMLFV
jgi:hypothetical protein